MSEMKWEGSEEKKNIEAYLDKMPKEELGEDQKAQKAMFEYMFERDEHFRLCMGAFLEMYSAARVGHTADVLVDGLRELRRKLKMATTDERALAVLNKLRDEEEE